MSPTNNAKDMVGGTYQCSLKYLCLSLDAELTPKQRLMVDRLNSLLTQRHTASACSRNFGETAAFLKNLEFSNIASEYRRSLSSIRNYFNT